MSRAGRRVMPVWARLVLCAVVVLALGWGTVRALVRAAPAAADWAALRWFVAIALALMALGVGTTVMCVFQGSRK